MITLEVNSKAIPFEIDTGSRLTIIPKYTYEKLFYCNPLQQCRVKVKITTVPSEGEVVYRRKSADVWNAESKSLSSAKRDRKLKLVRFLTGKDQIY